MSDQATLDAYRALLAATSDMLALARAEDWVGLREATQVQQEVVALLQAQNVPLDRLPEADREAIAGILRETELANKELADRVDLWKNELSSILQNIGSARVNVRKLARAYG